ncbi:MAG: glycosyltransferase family 4 protein, partial [Deltaproteobacteria bacterium]|nr:glycosyltransferase family 4 protein [Deltaproteobacteria bacterium]
SRAAMEQRGGLAHLAWQVGWTGIRIYSRLAFPDTQLFWCVRALPALLRLIRRQRPGVLVASIPPYSPALVAALVARASGIPLVVDYRDAWTQVLQAQHALGPKLRLSRAAERWVAASAAQLTAVTAQHAQVVARDVGAAHAGKLSVVPNALDFASWSTEGAATAAGQPAWAPGQPFTMIYAGGIYGQRSLQPLFAALGRLRRQGTVAAGAGQVRLLVYGAQSPRQLELARQEGVADQLSYSAGVPRSELLQHLSRAQLALAIQGEEYGHGLPSKVLEAIALGKPVLAISPPGSFLAGFLQDCGMGWSFGFDEVERIAELLQRLLQGSEPLSCLPRPGSLDRYQAERTVADFAAVLRRAAGGAPGG